MSNADADADARGWREAREAVAGWCEENTWDTEADAPG